MHLSPVFVTCTCLDFLVARFLLACSLLLSEFFRWRFVLYALRVFVKLMFLCSVPKGLCSLAVVLLEGFIAFCSEAVFVHFWFGVLYSKFVHQMHIANIQFRDLWLLFTISKVSRQFDLVPE